MLIKLSILCGNLEYIMNVFHAVSIDVENWCVNSFGKIGSVHSTSAFHRNGCETDLIVNNNVDCSTNSVIGQILHLHGLVNYTLSREGCVTMDQEWYNFITLRLIIVYISNMVFGSTSSHYDRVDAFQVRWVCKDLDGEFIA